MAETFEIALANPIRFVRPGSSRFDGNFATELINKFQNEICYCQKWQTDDSTRLQVLTDDPAFTFDIYELDSGEHALNVVPIEQDVNIVGHDFNVYEIPIDFGLLEPGQYYAQIAFADEYGSEVLWISEPMCVQENHPATLLYKYRNSENNFSVVFDTGIEFDIRVEGVIEEFTPESDDVIYNDQKRNATMLDSIPWRRWKLYVANDRGVPAWMADKMNRVMACDSVQIGDELGMDYYEKIEGATWEVERADQYAWLGMTLDIMPTENFFLQRLKTEGEDVATIQIVQHAENFFDVSGPFQVPGIFSRYTKLDEIVLENDGGPFTLTLGTTPGGTEIGEFDVTDPNTTIDIDWYFRADGQTLYIGGVTGDVPFVSVVWKELDPEPIDVGDVEDEPSTVLGVGAMIPYNPGSQANLDENFDLTTGLGRADTPWDGWAIANGNNGTQNWVNFFPYGGDSTNIGQTGGAAEVTLTENELPEINVRFDDAHAVGQASDVFDGRDAVFYSSSNPNLKHPRNIDREPFDPIGGGQAHNNIPPFRRTIWVQKIA